MARKNEEDEMTDLATDFRQYGYVDSYRSVPVASSTSALMHGSSSSASALRASASLPSISSCSSSSSFLNGEQQTNFFSLCGGSSIYHGNNHSDKSCLTASTNPNNGSNNNNNSSNEYDFACYYDGRDYNINKKEREEKEMEETMKKMEIGMGMGLELGLGMDINMEMEMQTSIDQKTKSESEKSKENLDIPFWSDGVDRFTNCVTKSDISPLSLMSIVKEILEQLNTDKNLLFLSDNDNNNDSNNNNSDSDSNSNSKDNADTNALTHIRHENIFRCRLVLDEYRICSFNIGIYKYEKENCLLDIQELNGEHLTFSHFLHIFKSQLQKRQIIEETPLTPEFIDNYGLSMDIDFDSF